MSDAKHPLSRFPSRAPAAAITPAARVNPLEAAGQDHPDAALAQRAADYRALYAAADQVEATVKRLERRWERLKPERPPEAQPGTAAHKAWVDECFPIAFCLGLPQAHAQLQNLEDQYCAILGEMMATPARTLQGLQIKAGILRTQQLEIYRKALIDELIAFAAPDTFIRESG